MRCLDNFNNELMKYYRVIEEQNAILANYQNLVESAELMHKSTGLMPFIHEYSRELEKSYRIAEQMKPLNIFYQTEISNLYREWQDSIQNLEIPFGHYSIFGIGSIIGDNSDIADVFADKFSILSEMRHGFVELYPEYGMEDNENDDAEAVDKKIISALVNSITGKSFTEADKKLIINALPIGDDVLKYLAENPEELYRLNPRDFEIIMAEIYSKLGYDVQLTHATRDGGKDIILTEHNTMGDWIFYAECKHHQQETQHVGVGVIRGLYGTILADRVNGGIVATNSFFTKPARKFILDNNCQCQIKLQDGENIINILKDLTNK